MLSPAKHHLAIPRDLKANLLARQRMLALTKGSRINQRALIQACREDIILWINLFVWQINPRKPGREVEPFISWTFQDRLFRRLLDSIECHCHESPNVHQHDMVWEKSREMGATWMFLIAADWLARFHPRKKILMISRSADAVDDGTSDSLLWRIRFIHEHLPDWLKMGMVAQKMHLDYKDSGSAITGEASTGRAGVGGRASVMFIDEFSQIKEDYQVLHRTSDTAGCRIFNGTHLGPAGAFYDLTQRVDWRKEVIHWSEHPDKRPGLYRYDPIGCAVEYIDKKFEYPQDHKLILDGTPTGGPFPGLRSFWYDQQASRKASSRAVAMDLDIDPAGATSQFFDALMLRELAGQYCRRPVWEGEIDHDSEGRPRGFVPREGGPLRMWRYLAPTARPVPGLYVVGCDISAGRGATPSCITIADARTGDKVVEYAYANILPEKLAGVAAALGWSFRSENGDEAKIAWEIPGPGQTFGDALLALGYRNVHHKIDKSTFGSGKPAAQAGWTANNQAKLALLTEYRAALHARQFINPSIEAIKECSGFKIVSTGFVEHAGERSAEDNADARVNHGDRVIADGLAWMLARDLGTQVKRESAPETKVGSLAWRRQLRQDKAREEEYA